MMKLTKLSLLITIIFFNLSTLTLAKTQVFPVQESPLEPSLKATIKNLKSIVKARDMKNLITYMDPQIRCDFGNCTGYKDFLHHWSLNHPGKSSLLWQHLERLLSLGGYFENTPNPTYIMPYYFNHIPTFHTTAGHQLEPLKPEFGVTIGKDVWLRQHPNFKTTVMKKLDNEVVQLLHDRYLANRYSTSGSESWPWKKVKTQDGVTGYVWGKYIYDNFQYRLGLRKINGRWLIQYMAERD